jgi:uncharacterized membrane protein YfcA
MSEWCSTALLSQIVAGCWLLLLTAIAAACAQCRFLYTQAVVIPVAIPLAFGSLVGAFLGAKVGVHIPETELKQLFGVMMAFLGGRTVLKAAFAKK